LPASKKANADKKDRLPTIDLMKKRKESVLCYWEAEYEAFPNRFAHEASRLLGKRLNTSNWENGLFSAFVEAVEVTAIQRGVERWQPAAFAATGTDGVMVSEAKTLKMEPEKAADTTELPFFANLAVACGVFRNGAASVELDTVRIPDSSGRLDPKRHFVVRASGDSMDGGISPIRDGEFVLLETNEGGSVSNQIFAVEYRDPTTGDTAFALKRVEKNLGTGEYHLVSFNKSYPPIPVEPETMIPFARFKGVLETGPLVGNA
jgi:phage repressor protein C with HTH and peptisase S24 domain